MYPACIASASPPPPLWVHILAALSIRQGRLVKIFNRLLRRVGGSYIFVEPSKGSMRVKRKQAG
jgi:hypothetical protein